MTLNQNINEAGWFYHAPARRRTDEAVGYPAMSQIPGLAEDEGPPEEPPRTMFRETDTKYVRLAKQGGRPNLLQIKENSGEKKGAVLYPKNEWYYLEDNAMEDEAEKQKNEIEYDFLRPDYMVHETFKKDPNNFYERPVRGPIAFDKLSIFEREPGKHATDKTVRLPELKKPGYGIRSGKPLRKQKNKPDSANTDPGRGPNPGHGPRPMRYLPMKKKPVGPESESPMDRTKISKLLGYAYEREWQDELKSWQDKQEIGRNRHLQMTNVPQQTESNIRSEYNVNFGKPSAVIHSDAMLHDDERSVRTDGNKSGYTVRQNEAQRLREAKLQKPVEKEAFKMTRFKNIPAKIDSQRHAMSQPQTVVN